MTGTKVAIVSGNNVGLGRLITERLPEIGYQKPEIIRSKDYDLKNPDSAMRLVKETVERFGGLDLLVNNVGNYINKPISEFSFGEWDEMIASNLHSAFYLSQAALPYLRESKGRILNIGFASMERLDPGVNVTAYQAAKTGLLVMTRGMAKEEANNGVLINMLSPGYMENTVMDPVMPKMPLNRFATLDEAVSAAFFLIQSNYITGQNLELAGGWGL
jgi:3-oxoacyl-[acyl-carrier protein] reductase